MPSSSSTPILIHSLGIWASWSYGNCWPCVKPCDILLKCANPLRSFRAFGCAYLPGLPNSLGLTSASATWTECQPIHPIWIPWMLYTDRKSYRHLRDRPRLISDDVRHQRKLPVRFAVCRIELHILRSHQRRSRAPCAGRLLVRRPDYLRYWVRGCLQACYNLI